MELLAIAAAGFALGIIIGIVADGMQAGDTAEDIINRIIGE